MKHLLSLLIISMITGCSTLNFWSSEEEDLEEPRPLQRIENLFKLDRIWSRGFNSDNSLGNYRIAFDGDEIIITNEDGDIFNINKFNGKVNNKYEFEVDVSVSVAFGFNKIVLADKDGMIYCLSAANKDLIWSLDSGAEVLSIPAIDAKAVVVHTSAGQLLAIDTNSGSLNWSYRSQLPNLTIRGNSTPLIANDQVFATFDNGRLGSFDIATGFSLFDGPISYKEGSSELENLIDADSTPVIEGPLVFATNYQGSLTGFSIQEGRPVLSIKSSSFHPPVIMSRNVVVIQDLSLIHI